VAWIKVDERFFTSTVVFTAGPLGAMLYLEGLTYCMRFNVDELPRIIVDTFWSRVYGPEAVAAAIAGLEEVAAFDPTDGGWLIHHYWVEDEVVIEGQSRWGEDQPIRAARAEAKECAHCGATERLEVDHIVPRSRGGYSQPSNLQILCKPCNIKKRSTVPWGALGGGRS
jgi:hypothetical protein